MDVFHYHLITSRVREVEARYVGKLGFALIARYGSLGDDLATFGPGVSWGTWTNAASACGCRSSSWAR